MLREVPKITKSLKQVIIGHQKNLALEQTPLKATNTAPLQEPLNIHERPSTSQFNRKTDLEMVQRRMMSAQHWIGVLTGVVYDPKFECPYKGCRKQRMDNNFVCQRCGMDMLSHYRNMFSKAQGTLAESHAATKSKGKKKYKFV